MNKPFNLYGKKPKDKLNQSFSESVCPVCKKRFIVMRGSEYAYKHGSKYYCSYKCFRVWQKEYLDKINKKLKGEKV